MLLGFRVVFASPGTTRSSGSGRGAPDDRILIERDRRGKISQHATQIALTRDAKRSCTPP